MEELDLQSEDSFLMANEERGPQNYQEQIEKIMNFQAITQTANSDLAAKYLVQNNWDESAAAREYFDEINRQDFENAQRRVHNLMREQAANPEAQALIEDHNYYMREFDYNNHNNGPSVFSTILNYTIMPILRGTKNVASYLIPRFVKKATCKVFSFFSTPYAAAMFVDNLRENQILNAELQNKEETKINFQEAHFVDAVAQGYRTKKPIMFIFADLMIDEIKEILKEIFNDEEAVRTLANNFLVFGIETGSAEANSLSIEFAIKEIPYFATVI